MESTSSGQNDDVEWELRHDDDGFVYKRKKKRRPDPSPPPSPSAAADDAEARRREWKEKALLNLKSKYQSEIEHWELLSNELKVLEEKRNQIQQRSDERDQTASFSGSDASRRNWSESVLDELLLVAEAQEAIIGEVSNLCDVVESMCRAQDEHLVQSLIDLPIWDSPRKLMKSLCD